VLFLFVPIVHRPDCDLTHQSKHVAADTNKTVTKIYTSMTTQQIHIHKYVQSNKIVSVPPVPRNKNTINIQIYKRASVGCTARICNTYSSCIANSCVKCTFYVDGVPKSTAIFIGLHIALVDWLSVSVYLGQGAAILQSLQDF